MLSARLNYFDHILEAYQPGGRGNDALAHAYPRSQSEPIAYPELTFHRRARTGDDSARDEDVAHGAVLVLYRVCRTTNGNNDAIAGRMKDRRRRQSCVAKQSLDKMAVDATRFLPGSPLEVTLAGSSPPNHMLRCSSLLCLQHAYGSHTSRATLRCVGGTDKQTRDI
jgi:hypothetical protein